MNETPSQKLQVENKKIMSAIQLNAINEFLAILRKAVPDIVLPENTTDLMISSMQNTEQTGVKMKIDHVLKSLKSVNGVKLLPFSPISIDYMMDTRCCALELDSCLFTPCCKSRAEGQFCKEHIKGTKYGTYEDRLKEWNDGNGIGTYSVEVDGTTYTECTYGEYLAKKGISYEQVQDDLRRAGLPIRIEQRNLEIRRRVNKSRGRPAEKKVEVVDETSTSENSSDEDRIQTIEPKDVKSKISEEIQDDENRQNKSEDKKTKASQKAEKVQKKEEEKKLFDERKAVEKVAKEKLATEKAVTKSRVKKGTSLDKPFELYSGELSELDEAEHPETEESVWIDNARNVYDATKKKIGTIDEEGNFIRV